MKREPDNADVIDDSGAYDVRSIREREDRIVYVERNKRPDWLVGIASLILAGGIGAAWTANARLSSLEQSVSDLRGEVARLERLLEPRYRGAPDDSNAH